MKTLGDMKNYLSKVFERDASYIANLIGVTDKTLNSWNNTLEFEVEGKQNRLKCLYVLIKYTESKNINTPDLLNFVHNSRIVIDPSDAEYGDTSVLSYCYCEFFNERNWMDRVDEAINEWKKQREQKRAKDLENTNLGFLARCIRFIIKKR